MKTMLSRVLCRKTSFRLGLSSLLVCALAPIGCSDKAATQSTPSETATPGQSAPGRMTIKGSNTIGEELAPRLIAEYKKDQPTADLALECKATGYGLASLMAGQCDIAAASREPIKEELELAASRGVEFKPYVIGSYSVAVIVNAACPATNLTKDQVRDIFIGVVTNWNAVGGPDAPIHLYARDPVSGTYLGFRELAMENKPYSHVTGTSTNYAGIVKAVAGDTAGIGYCSLELAGKPGVKAVSVDGVAPSMDSVKAGKYPYARVLRLYTDKAKEPKAAAQFIQFVLSDRGQAIVVETGNVPHP